MTDWVTYQIFMTLCEPRLLTVHPLFVLTLFRKSPSFSICCFIFTASESVIVDRSALLSDNCPIPTLSLPLKGRVFSWLSLIPPNSVHLTLTVSLYGYFCKIFLNI